jgi:hypothetical protein
VLWFEEADHHDLWRAAISGYHPSWPEDGTDPAFGFDRKHQRSSGEGAITLEWLRSSALRIKLKDLRHWWLEHGLVITEKEYTEPQQVVGLGARQLILCGLPDGFKNNFCGIPETPIRTGYSRRRLTMLSW